MIGRFWVLGILFFSNFMNSVSLAGNVDLIFPGGQGFKYALISSDILGLPNGDQNLSTSYESYISHQVSQVRQDDIIIVHALVEGTHQPDGVASVAEFASYITCDGIRATPHRQKSLKRKGGNHHGSMVMSGFCHVLADSQASVNIDLLAKINVLPGIIHDHAGAQTQLVVNHYRLVQDGDNLDGFWMPITSFKADNSGPNLIFPNPSDPRSTKYLFLSVNQDVEAGDLVYLSAHAVAEDPDPGPRMFGFELMADNDQLAVATENLIPEELYRISQYGLSMWKANADQQKTFKTQVYSITPNGVTLLARRNYSRLEGMVFRKGYETDSMFLTDIERGYMPVDFNVYPNGAQYNLMSPKVINFDGAGLMRIKAFTDLQNSGTDKKSCYIRIGVSKDSEPESYSVVSGRYFKYPYVHHNLSIEWLYPVDSAGSYTVRPYIYCGPNTSSSPITVKIGGSWATVEKFEK